MAIRRGSARHDLWIVLPVSGVARGKSRLASALSLVERQRLNRQLVRHGVRVGLDALGEPSRCIVVSPCVRSLYIARAAGAVALAQVLPARGLNAAIRQALRYALRRGARRLLILPVDLPRMSVIDLDRMLHLGRRPARSLVVPDRERAGTNALLLTARLDNALHFGPGSYAKHCRSAREAGESPVICELPALTQDLDTPEHLAAWIATGRRWGR